MPTSRQPHAAHVTGPVTSRVDEETLTEKSLMGQRYPRAARRSAPPRYPFGGNPVAAAFRGAGIVGSMPRVIVAGAGFGGLATAVALRREHTPAELEIIVVDRRDDFVMGLRKTWAALGMAALSDGRRRMSDLRGVTILKGEITSLDPGARAVEIDGRRHEADALVVALGADHALEAIPGLAEHGINVWHVAEVERACAAISRLDRGRLAIGIFGTPYSCPPAPFELALLARDRLGSSVEVALFSPANIALPVVGATESAKVEHLLAVHGIEFLAARRSTSVAAHEVRFADGSTLAFDLLLAVPPHRCPKVLVVAGLAEPTGWVKPDPRTMETSYPSVYAVGDCTVIMLANGLPLPKAGIFAEQQGEVVAARIRDTIRGREPTATFTGDGYCYVETGSGQAAKASGSFLSDPVAVVISEPTTAALDEKREFEQSRLRSWFGY